MTDVEIIEANDLDVVDSVDLPPLDLPPGIADMVEFSPYEDLLLAIFERGLPQLQVRTLIPPSEYIEYPLVLVRRKDPVGLWRGDPRFVDKGQVLVSVFTEDPDGEHKGIIISEAIRVMLRKAWLEHWHFPGLGSIVEINMMKEPIRVVDWATASGPVQYAELPGNVWRTESEYSLTVKRPIKK